MLSFFIDLLIVGLSIGIVYGLVAIGISLIYSGLDIVHFAHGEIYMFGAFMGLTLYTTVGGLGIIIAGFGMSIVLQNLAFLIWGPKPLPLRICGGRFFCNSEAGIRGMISGCSGTPVCGPMPVPGSS